MPNQPRGTVTFLFTDIEGSTQHWERQPESMKSALARHDTLLHTAIDTHGGYVFKTMGDAFCAAFATAPDALEAAQAVQRALRSEAWDAKIGELRVRIALHTGTAEERDGDYFGPSLNRVSRLLSAGHGGQILLSLATQELVRDQLPKQTSLLDLGEHRLKDLFRPERVYQFNVPDLPMEFPPLNTLDARLTNLPAQPTPLIGREREMAAVLGLLRREEVRLVTLTGPGGTGKTRLSLHTAADLVDEYQHGVFFVNLTPITDHGLVVSTIASTLKIKEASGEPIAQTLNHALHEKHMLLVLDNFEQIIEAAPQVGDLLAAAPKLKIMVSSREALRVRGEHNYPVPPLGLPEPGRKPTMAVLSQYESVALFIQCAKAARTDFEISEDNAPAIAEICMRLDGLPLAIELIATRSRMLTPQAMLEKLSSRLKAVTGGARDLPARQRTLRAAIDWSYDLLDEKEKKLFARLSVFQGGRSIEAVDAVCGLDLELDATDGLESLFNKSLLRQEEGLPGEARFVMLETIHEYARERLRDSGESETIHRRHAEYFVSWVEQFKRDIRAGGQQYARFAWLDVEYNNLRTALEWSLEGSQPELGLRMIGAVWPYWWRQGMHIEWRGWISWAEKVSANSSPVIQAGILVAKGKMLDAFNQLAESRQAHMEALAIYRPLGDAYDTGMTLVELAGASIGFADEYWEAVSSCQEGLALLRQIDAKAAVAYALNVLGELARVQGEYDLAQSAYEECLALAKEIGDKLREAIQCDNLGSIALDQGDYAQAQRWLRRAGVLAVKLGNQWLVLDNLAILACAMGGSGQLERAARLIGASEALHTSHEVEIQAGNRAEYEHGVKRIREQLGEEMFNALRKEGSVMSLDEAVAFAMKETDDE